MVERVAAVGRFVLDVPRLALPLSGFGPQRRGGVTPQPDIAALI
ncbi:hypothetical protein [Mycobacteroides abscessus]|nr:Uncharacterised protein [Mycobacteroides abscessus subsp. massiliense]SKY99176.1 Uncharacterised protein [Mycobacteroides abscessus subsp. massiliense]